MNPSSGNLHPTEGYLVLPPAPGIDDAAGVWHERPHDHALERRAALDDAAWRGLGLPEGAFLAGLTSIPWREAWKYGERAFRYCLHDAGHALAALALAASLRGWRLRVQAWSHLALATILGTARDADFPVEEEREEPELVAVVGPESVDLPEPAPEALDRVRAAPWRGTANRLSPDHERWDVVHDVAAAVRSPGGGGPIAAGPRWPTFPEIDAGRPARDARRVIRTRRSAVAFDPDGRTDRVSFLRILDAVLSRGGPPWTSLPSPVAVHLALFVHAVEGVPPGLHVLVRDPEAEPALRRAMDDRFSWETPDGVPDGFPLRRLARGDVRDAAASLSCGQAIAGDSFFSLGMIADLGSALDARGPTAYGELLREAGAVGQVLYLEAEAAGARGTGIGCYFDDPVHEALGLAGGSWRSLYHFTVGRPVEDDRLTTLPAYPADLVAARSRS